MTESPRWRSLAEQERSVRRALILFVVIFVVIVFGVVVMLYVALATMGP